MIMKFIDFVLIGLSRICFGLAAICLSLIAAYGTVDVVWSFLGDGGMPMAREASSALLAAAVFLSFAYAQFTRADIRVDVISAHFPRGLQRFSGLMSITLGMGVFGLLTWQCWENFLRSWTIGETAMALYHFPIYPSKLALAVGSAAAMLELVRQFIHFFFDTREPVPNGAADAPEPGIPSPLIMGVDPHMKMED